MSEFEDQLKQEELARLKAESGETTQTEYTDADGTVYEWDADKKAWFPKIDADFIAKYQMNYGVDSKPECGDTVKNAEHGETQPEYSKEEYEKYWENYNNYYYYYQQGEQGEQSGGQGESNTPTVQGATGNEVKSSDMVQSTREQGGGDEEDRNSDYYHYFSQYYDENYIPSPAVSQDADNKDGGQGTSDTNQGKKKQTVKAGEKRKPQSETGWVQIDDDKNTNVYVSGLPLDVTDEEFKELMSKCGLIMPDLVTKEPKIKLYRDEKGEPKGDGRCCYIKVESVNLALQILDGSNLRGHTVRVERAQFTMKGNFDPKKRRKKLNAKEKKKLLQQQQKLLDWKPEISDSRMRWEKTVILKHMFDPKEFEDDPMLINELREDVREECTKYGEVKKVILYDRHPEGVMAVNFKEFEPADQCVLALNGRWFAKKRISAETWDGKTKYEIEESTAEREERLKKWSDFLEAEEKKEKSSNPTVTASAGASSSDKAALAESSASSVNASASGSSARDGAPDMDTDRTSDGSGNAQSESAAAGEAL